MNFRKVNKTSKVAYGMRTVNMADKKTILFNMNIWNEDCQKWFNSLKKKDKGELRQLTRGLHGYAGFKSDKNRAKIDQSALSEQRKKASSF